MRRGSFRGGGRGGIQCPPGGGLQLEGTTLTQSTSEVLIKHECLVDPT